MLAIWVANKSHGIAVHMGKGEKDISVMVFTLKRRGVGKKGATSVLSQSIEMTEVSADLRVFAKARLGAVYKTPTPTSHFSLLDWRG